MISWGGGQKGGLGGGKREDLYVKKGPGFLCSTSPAAVFFKFNIYYIVYKNFHLIISIYKTLQLLFNQVRCQ